MPISFHLNKEEIKTVCKKLNCLNNEIGKVLKQSLVDNDGSPLYRPLFNKKPEGVKLEDLEKFVENAIDYYLVNTEFLKINDRISRVNASVNKPTEPDFKA